MALSASATASVGATPYARATRAGQRFERRPCLLDREARLGDALTVDGRFARDVILPSLDEVALDHRAEDLPRSGCDLLRDRSRHLRLAEVILQAVSVRAVHHHALVQPLCRKPRG